MIRRLPAGRPVRVADGDADALRLAASAANEAVDAVTREPAAKVGAALHALALRYGRALDVDAKAIAEALQDARAALKQASTASVSQRTRSPGVRSPEPAEPSEFAKAMASRQTP
jgi:non-specific serine/threonine protein kinase